MIEAKQANLGKKRDQKERWMGIIDIMSSSRL